MAKQAKNLSEVQLRAWLAAGKPVAKSDGDGLTFTLSSAGAAVWVLRYRVGGRRREVTLGRYPDYSLKKARQEAREARVRVSKGVDVAAEKRREKHAGMAAWTVRQLVADYEAKVLSVAAASTRKLYKMYLTNWIVPRLGAMLAVDVSVADVVAMLRASSSRGTGAMRTLHAAARAVFEHARGQAIRPDNPALGIKRSSIAKAEERREGVALEGEVLAKFLRAIPDDVKGWALRLHLITGVRPGELCEAAWAEFDLERGSWSIPAERTKTGSGYVIVLPSQVLDLLRKIAANTPSSAYVFPAARGEDRPIPYQTYRAWLWRALDAAGIPRGSFKPHDLRRTMRSGLASLGVRYEVAERAINHKLPGMAEIYDRNDYAVERAAALRQWADQLDVLGTGTNVVPIKRMA
ncbi:tyrosine-type recombinase/integrase [Dokdonella ginsengisoli]|uniref:Tyrosine-type recombinase/integrase n=1 Tax=Dokdonella ginsengisoli TaxID=363846 RepID=A0ABV9QZX1_9GAMM